MGHIGNGPLIFLMQVLQWRLEQIEVVLSSQLSQRHMPH